MSLPTNGPKVGDQSFPVLCSLDTKQDINITQPCPRASVTLEAQHCTKYLDIVGERSIVTLFGYFAASGRGVGHLLERAYHTREVAPDKAAGPRNLITAAAPRVFRLPAVSQRHNVLFQRFQSCIIVIVCQTLSFFWVELHAWDRKHIKHIPVTNPRTSPVPVRKERQLENDYSYGISLPHQF